MCKSPKQILYFFLTEYLLRLVLVLTLKKKKGIQAKTLLNRYPLRTINSRVHHTIDLISFF